MPANYRLFSEQNTQKWPLFAKLWRRAWIIRFFAHRSFYCWRRPTPKIHELSLYDYEAAATWVGTFCFVHTFINRMGNCDESKNISLPYLNGCIEWPKESKNERTKAFLKRNKKEEFFILFHDVYWPCFPKGLVSIPGYSKECGVIKVWRVRPF